MAGIETLWERLAAHDVLLWWLFAASVTVFLVSPVVVAWLVVRLPSDYFVQPKRRRLARWQQNPVWRLVIFAGKNLMGIVLLLAGLVMLVTPGQGVLTVAVGLLMLDFPGKYRLERWLVTRRPVWRSINWLRKRARRSALESPY